MQSQKEQQSIRRKLGSILGLGASRAIPSPQKSYEELGKLEHTAFITQDVLRELDSVLPVAHRVRAMRELHDIVATKRLEDNAVQAVWRAVSDLLAPGAPADVRQSTLVFTQALITGQYDDLGILRAHFFHVVQNHSISDDTKQRLDVLRALTLNGKDIQHMEESIGPFLQSWMPEVVAHDNEVTADFLALLVHFVHYNAAYLDEDVLVGLVSLSCGLASRSTQPEVISLCLDFLNAVVCYSSLPSDALQAYIQTLCHTLNIERFSKKSLDVMLKLLGTHLGRSAIYTMCTLIRERCAGQDALLLRGAVFYLSMSMWGIRRVENLDLSFASVLPSISQAVQSGHTIVVFEVCLSLSRLVRTHARRLAPLEWSAIFAIMEGVQRHLAEVSRVKGEPADGPSNALGQSLRDLFLVVEELYEGGTHIGAPEKFFALVEDSMYSMPLRSVLTLVSYRTRMLDSLVPGWVGQVTEFMERFYRTETRTAIRIEALNFLASLLTDHRLAHEAVLMEEVLFPFLRPVAWDEDTDVRCRAVQLLVHLLSEATPTWAEPLLGVIGSVLDEGLKQANRHRHHDNKSTEAPRLPDSKAAVFGLTAAFKSKLHSSSAVSAHVLSLLVGVVQRHYQDGCLRLPTACIMRINIFDCILSVRSNELGQLGCRDNDGSIKFSPFYVCMRPVSSSEAPPTKLTPTLVDYHTVFEAMLSCLQKECEWEVLSCVLQGLRGVLQDRTLTVSAMPDLSALCLTLCRMLEPQQQVSRPRGEQQHHHVSTAWSRSELASSVYPVLATLLSFPTHLDRTAQHLLVCCLEAGLVGWSAEACLAALSLASLELQAAIARLLPRVLYRLGQVAATPTLALPVLEFLSGLIPVPVLYSGFVEQQYLSVFAIALPYTDSSRYTAYVVALAYRVVAQWFVQCRVQYRPSVARYITKNLSQELPVAGSDGGGGQLEVCSDMLLRYTYSNLSSLPTRSSEVDFLISGGPSKTWIVGNSLVTITTSGLGGGSEGVCSRCALIRNAERTPQTADSRLDSPQLCSCWCLGWAEVKVRRPTGNVAWVMRLQNATKQPAPSVTLGGGDWGLLAASLPLEETLLSGVAEESEEEGSLAAGETEGLATGGEEDVLAGEDGRWSGEEAAQCGRLQEYPPNGAVPPAKSSTPLDDPTVENRLSNGSSHTEEEEEEEEGTAMASDSTTIPPVKRQPNSQSWSEVSDPTHPSLLPAPPSSSSLPPPPPPYPSSVEHLPPLLSYDSGEECSRSPSLLGNSKLLSEKEQLCLHAFNHESKEGGEDDREQFSSSGESELSLAGSYSEEEEEEEEEGAEHRTSARPPPVTPSHRPRLKKQSVSLPEESATVGSVALDPSLLPSNETTPPSSRRQSAPSPYTTLTPSHSPSRGRKRIMFTQQPPHAPTQSSVVPEDSAVFNNPSFVFLQLYHSHSFGGVASDKPLPLLLPSTDAMERGVKVLDCIPPYDTHKIGVVYVAKGQSLESEILANVFGSSRYLSFLQELAPILRLADCAPDAVYLGGLDRSGIDGEFAYCYQDDITQVIFHVATLLPTLPSDPHCSNKKLHIGNDYVTIVYNDSEREYTFGTVKGQFNFVEVIVEPLTAGMNRVSIKAKKGLDQLVQSEACIISDTWLPLLVRQKAVQANLASLVHVSETAASTEAFSSNWLGRLHQIQRLREKCSSETTRRKSHDFTSFC